MHILPNPIIGLLPFGNVNEDVLRVVADMIQGVLRIPVETLHHEFLPPHAFMEERQQFNAMVILRYLAECYSDNWFKVLGITGKDLANPILTHVFGEGYMGGKAAVISYHRLYRGFDDSPVSREQFLERVAKVALHEIGHTFNLPHCRRERCVMRVSNGLSDLDQKLSYLCDYCELFLHENLEKALDQNA